MQLALGPPPGSGESRPLGDRRFAVLLTGEAVIGALLGLLLLGEDLSSTQPAPDFGAVAETVLLLAAAIALVVVTVIFRRSHHEPPGADTDPSEPSRWTGVEVLASLAGGFVLSVAFAAIAAGIVYAAFGLGSAATAPANALSTLAATIVQLVSYAGLLANIAVVVVWRHRGGLPVLGWVSPRPRIGWGWLALAIPVALGTIVLADFLLLPLNNIVLPNAPTTQCSTVRSAFSAALISIPVICVVAPMCEETIFRGFLFRWMRGHTGWPLAALLSGFIFAAYHLQPGLFLPLWGVGCVLAVVYQRSGSLYPGMAVHGLFNLPGLLVILAPGHHC